MARHSARTAEQITEAAEQGTQWNPRTIVDAHNARNTAKETALREEMTAAYTIGRNDALGRMPLYDASTAAKEYRNAIAAYDAADTEPAISYIIGYAGGLTCDQYPN